MPLTENQRVRARDLIQNYRDHGRPPSGASNNDTPALFMFAIELQDRLREAEKEVETLTDGNASATRISELELEVAQLQAKLVAETDTSGGLSAKLENKAFVPTEVHRAEIKRLVAAGSKIEALKYYREASGLGLKEAKDFVDSIIPTVETGSNIVQFNAPVSRAEFEALKSLVESLTGKPVPVMPAPSLATSGTLSVPAPQAGASAGQLQCTEPNTPAATKAEPPKPPKKAEPATAGVGEWLNTVEMFNALGGDRKNPDSTIDFGGKQLKYKTFRMREPQDFLKGGIEVDLKRKGAGEGWLRKKA